MMTRTIKVTKPSEIRRAGAEALVKALGPIGMARYLEDSLQMQKDAYWSIPTNVFHI